MAVAKHRHQRRQCPGCSPGLSPVAVRTWWLLCNHGRSCKQPLPFPATTVVLSGKAPGTTALGVAASPAHLALPLLRDLAERGFLASRLESGPPLLTPRPVCSASASSTPSAALPPLLPLHLQPGVGLCLLWACPGPPLGSTHSVLSPRSSFQVFLIIQDASSSQTSSDGEGLRGRVEGGGGGVQHWGWGWGRKRLQGRGGGSPISLASLSVNPLLTSSDSRLEPT